MSAAAVASAAARRVNSSSAGPGGSNGEVVLAVARDLRAWADRHGSRRDAAAMAGLRDLVGRYAGGAFRRHDHIPGVRTSVLAAVRPRAELTTYPSGQVGLSVSTGAPPPGPNPGFAARFGVLYGITVDGAGRWDVSAFSLGGAPVDGALVRGLEAVAGVRAVVARYGVPAPPRRRRRWALARLWDSLVERGRPAYRGESPFAD